MMGVAIGSPWRERALSRLAEAGFEDVGEEGLRDQDKAIGAYWSAVEGCYHFEEPDILRCCVRYDGSAEDVAARLAAVLMLRERIERLRWAVEGVEEEGEAGSDDGRRRR